MGCRYHGCPCTRRAETITGGRSTRREDDALKPWIVNCLKIVIAIGILAYLVRDVRSDQLFTEFLAAPKDYGQFTLAWCVCFVGVVLTFVRWHTLVRALGLPFSFWRAMRLGFLGYLLNFVALGAVGGDLFKAVAVAREHPQRRPEAVATVLFDRVIGLYALFVLSAMAVLWFRLFEAPHRETRLIAQATLFAAALSTLGLSAMLVPGVSRGRITLWLTELPRVGSIIGKLLGAVRLYRQQPVVLAVALLQSVAAQACFALTFYLVSRGLPGASPDLAEHGVIVPLAMITGVLPLPMSGLGAFEMVVDLLYRYVPTTVSVQPGQGLIVALVYRLITIVIAAVGAISYLSLRHELANVQSPDLSEVETGN